MTALIACGAIFVFVSLGVGGCFFLYRRPTPSYVPMPIAVTAAPSASPNPQVGYADSAEVKRAVAEVRGLLRACISGGLRADPNMVGSVGVLAEIDAAGNVASAQVTGSLPPAVATCIQARVTSAKFPPPGEGHATISIPVSVATK